MPNYTYVVDSNFHPFSMQEMLVPLSAYKEEYEKSEEAYNELSKADTFNYLKETLPEGSKARQIYEGYAGDLEKQAKDLSSNGLTMANRKAIVSLKRRFNGEIGRLTRADEAMREEKKLRQSINAQDSSRLYATDNLNIDDFLDGKNPNLYNVSGNEIYARAAQAGKSISSRVFSTSEGQRLLNNYYIDLVQTNGLSQDTLDKFYEDASSNPTLKRAMDDVLEEMGVPQNLTGINRKRAEKYALSGMMDGAIYQESHSPQRDLSMIDAGTQAQLDLQKQELGLRALAKSNKTDKSNTKETKGNYPLPTKTEYVPGNNRANPEFIEGSVPNSGTKVNVNMIGDSYEVSVGEGNDKLILGVINSNGEISNVIGTKSEDYKNFAKYFDKGGHWWQINHTYDPEYDQDNIKSMLKDIVSITKRGGKQGYINYDYYLEPDNQSYDNHGGGFYRVYLGPTPGSVFNEDPRAGESNLKYDEL